MDTVIMATEDTAFDAAISIGPNPVRDILNVESSVKPIKVARLYSANGQLVKSVSFGSGYAAVEIGVRDLSKGFYQLVVEVEGVLHREKIVKF